MVTEWERNFDAFANQVMGTEAYSEAMNQMQKAQLSYQRGFSEVYVAAVGGNEYAEPRGSSGPG